MTRKLGPSRVRDAASSTPATNNAESYGYAPTQCSYMHYEPAQCINPARYPIAGPDAGELWGLDRKLACGFANEKRFSQAETSRVTPLCLMYTATV
jgi:hypothetical protein